MAAVTMDFDRKSFSVFRSDEQVLNDKEVSYLRKIDALIRVWDTIADLPILEYTLDELRQIVEWAKLHALNIILEAEWSQFSVIYDYYLKRNIQRSQFHLAKVNNGFVLPCEKLLDVMKNPWQHPQLLKILKCRESCTQDELLDFFRMETGYLTSVRLMKLCERRCEDMALNLATAFIDSFYLSGGLNKMIKATHSQVWFIFDVFICLLYKFGMCHKVYQMLSGLTLEEGLSLVKRFATKSKRMKLWTVSWKIAKYASQIYISKIAFEFNGAAEHVFAELLRVYHILCLKDSSLPEFITSIRRISNITNRDGIHTLCKILHGIEDSSLKHFQIEMYIKVMTTDINECEMCKISNETNRVKLITSELAETICKLSKLLDDNVNVAIECVLTGFSLEPTEERLKLIEAFAVRCGIPIEQQLNWKCRLHPPVLKTDELMWKCSECGDWMTKPQLTRPVENNIILHQLLRSDILGIPQTLCDDLSVCISYSRYQMLSWYHPWADLHRLCMMYLKDPIATKNFITDLKYVDIDYSIFRNIKKEPVEDLPETKNNCPVYLYLDDKTNNEQTEASGVPTSSSTPASTLKEFIVKLNPLQISADVLRPMVVLQRDKDIQHLLRNLH